MARQVGLWAWNFGPALLQYLLLLQVQNSKPTGQLALPNIPPTFPTTGHIMPGFNHILLGMGPIYDTDCTVTFIKDSVVERYANNRSILIGWREAQAPYLWRIALLPDNADIPKVPQDAARVSLVAYSAYDLPSVEALVRYFHAAAGFPVRSTWLDAVKSVNYASWPGLTINNARKYCPSANETILGNLVQGRQGVCSTKGGRRGARSPATPATMIAPPVGTSDNQLHTPRSCTYNCGTSVNYILMIPEGFQLERAAAINT